MKYAFVRDHRLEFSVDMMCELMSISTSGFYAWLRRDPMPRDAAKAQLLRKIEDVFRGGRGGYGSPRVFRVLKGLGEKVSKSTVERLMREHRIRARTKRRFRATTNSKHELPVAENTVARQFDRGAPHRVWCADITYLWTDEGWLYLAAVIDGHTRKVVGWAMDERMQAELVVRAFENAIHRQSLSAISAAQAKLVHHSDRGVQYASYAFQEALRRFGVSCSMSRKGNCWDNAMAESFFHSLKVEHVYHERFATRREARSSVFEWIEVFYNKRRIHTALGFVSPECYERQSAS